MCSKCLHTVTGHIAAFGESKKGAVRSLLRIHIHQLSVLEHPCLSTEERIFARMREVFQQYSSLVQQDNLGYDSYLS